MAEVETLTGGLCPGNVRFANDSLITTATCARRVVRVALAISSSVSLVQ